MKEVLYSVPKLTSKRGAELRKLILAQVLVAAFEHHPRTSRATGALEPYESTSLMAFALICGLKLSVDLLAAFEHGTATGRAAVPGKVQLGALRVAGALLGHTVAATCSTIMRSNCADVKGDVQDAVRDTTDCGPVGAPRADIFIQVALDQATLTLPWPPVECGATRPCLACGLAVRQRMAPARKLPLRIAAGVVSNVRVACRDIGGARFWRPLVLLDLHLTADHASALTGRPMSIHLQHNHGRLVRGLRWSSTGNGTHNDYYNENREHEGLKLS